MNTTPRQTGSAFDLSSTYVQLEDGPTAAAIEVDEHFWDNIENRPALHGGRLVGTFHNASDWDVSEMHPDGDEVVCLLSGAIDVVLEEEDGKRIIELHPGATCIVPRSVWHTATVHTPGDT